MNIVNYSSKKLFTYLFITAIASFSLTGCNSSDEEGVGFIQLYNLSANAPAIYLTVDQYDNNDFNEKTHSAISFTKISSRLTYDSDTYDLKLAWQSESNNQYDLETVYQDQLRVDNDNVQLIVISQDIKNPSVMVYEIPLRDEDEINDDNDDEVFNISVLNMHNDSAGIDIYYSESDETFNQAELLSQATYSQMSARHKIAQDDYIFYLTIAGSNEVLFESPDIAFAYASDYIMVIRENQGAGSSPFVLDRISTSSIEEYVDSNAEASYRVFNGIVQHELLPDYQQSFDFHLNGIDDTSEIASLDFGQFSQSLVIASGDYSMTAVTPELQSPIISNHLLVLNENTDKTVFFYLLEKAVDEDGDGDIDENGDGDIDDIEITVNSLVVDNNQSSSIYQHQMKVVNLIDQDEIIDNFSSIKVYFVRNDETIESAAQSLTALFATPSSVNLLNNTYNVYVIGRLDSSDIILSSTQITLDEASVDQFIILEKNAETATGYTMTFANQTSD